MRDLGYERDWQQCKVKINNLQSIYRDIKGHNGEARRERKTCKFREELDEILGHSPASIPPVLLDSGTTSNTTTTWIVLRKKKRTVITLVQLGTNIYLFCTL